MNIYSSKATSISLPFIVSQMTKNAITSYYSGYRIFLKDTKGQYSSSKLGFLWEFLEPLLFALVFVFLYKSRSFNFNDFEISYAAFVSCGLLFWQIFVDSLLLPLGVINKSKNLINHVNITPESLIYSVFFRVYFLCFFRILALVSILVFLGEFNFVGLIKLLLAINCLMLIGFSVGFFLAPFNVVCSDVGNTIKLILRPLMFISGTIFPISGAGFIGYIYKFNPVAYVIEQARNMVTNGTNSYNIWMYFPVLFCMFFVSWYVFHVSFRVISERV